jgi:nitrite reductase (NO-forming)
MYIKEKTMIAPVAISLLLIVSLGVLPSLFAQNNKNVYADTSNINSLSSNSRMPMVLSSSEHANLNFIMPAAFTEVSTQAMQNMNENGARIHNVTLVAIETNVTLPQGNVIHAFTFNGTVPAPTIRVTQGDIINLKLINHPDNILIHSIDHHASIISAVPNFGPVNVGNQTTYSFVATQPGFFKYHCEGNGVIGMDQHVFSGMAGGVIVDPANGYTGYTYTTYDENGTRINQTVSADAKEVVFEFSEWYLDKDGNYNQTAMYNHLPTHTSINGIPFGYEPVITHTKNAMPIHIKQGDHVRFFLLNIGDELVNFHIVGEQLDRIIDGQVVAGWGKQTYLLGGSNDAIIDVVFNKPGVYAPVNHNYADLFKGQAGLIVVDGKDGQPGKSLGLTDYKNPANAIPPVGKNSIPVETKPYYLGSPIKWNGQSSSPVTSELTGKEIKVGKNVQVPIVPGSNVPAAGGGAPPFNVTTPQGNPPEVPQQ